MLGGLTVSPLLRAETPCPPFRLTTSGGDTGAPADCPRAVGSGPAWVDSLNLYEWTALPNANTFQDVWAPDTGQYGNTGPRSVMIAWSGAVLATGMGSHGSMVHWGGGHQDYYGNELYAFDLNTLTWSRLNDPSPHATAANIRAGLTNGLYPDGTPGVPHTYAGIIYRSAANEFVTTRRELDNLGGNTTTKISKFDLASLDWANHPESMSPTSRWNLCVYDPSRDVLWAVNTDHARSLSWSKFDFNSGGWTNYTEPSEVVFGSAAAYVPTKDCVVFWSDNLAPAYGLDPANPTNDKVELNLTGVSIETTSISDDSAHWSENLGAIVYYPSRSSTIYTLSPPAGDWKAGQWTARRLGTSGSSGTHSGSNGTFGKFQVAEWGGTTVGIVNSDINGPCYAIRLA